MPSTPSQNCFSKLHRVVREFGMVKVLEVLPAFFTAKEPSKDYKDMRKKLEEASELYKKERTIYIDESIT